MKREEIEKELQQVRQQRQIAEINFHRLSGAEAMLEKLLAKMEPPESPAAPAPTETG